MSKKKQRTETGTIKTCSKCGEIKDLCHFYEYKQGKRAGACDVCVASRTTTWAKAHTDNVKTAQRCSRKKRKVRIKILKKEWDLNNPDKVKHYGMKANLKSKYGLTIEERQDIENEQGGCCPICQCKLETGRHTHVDHNHDTGQVRGVLCRECNLGIAAARESPEILDRMKAYLAAHKFLWETQ